MADQKISDLSAAGALTGTELIETVQGGVNVQTTTQDIADLAGSGVTREFNRTFSETLVFDKNEIFHSPFAQSAAINLTIGAGGLVDESSSMRFRMTADGVNPVNFGPGFDFLYGIENGQILTAGTYEFYFLYTNGSVVVNVPGVTAETSSLVVLSAPANFAAVVNGENQIDLSWDDVDNESSYEIEFSSTGGSGPWVDLTNPAADATTYSHTGLSAGTTYHYRIRSVGDGINFANSAWSIVAETTESSGDVTAPTFTFLPASGNTVWPINKPIIITADEALRNTDGSELTSANVATRLTLKETDSSGSNIAFTATIDVTKTVITITPTTHYGENQLVYVAINNVEDNNGNEVTVAEDSTFTTTDYTFFNGTSNRLMFGDILDSLFSATDTEFRIKLTINNLILIGQRILVSKWNTSDNQRSFRWYTDGTDILFGWAGLGTGNNGRFIKWAGAVSAGEHTLELRYDGSIDSSDGLDRVTLLVDSLTAGSKTLVSSAQTLTIIFDGTAQLAVGALVSSTGSASGSLLTEEAKDFVIEISAGTVEEINVPNLKTGIDTSGNGHNGTWV